MHSKIVKICLCLIFLMVFTAKSESPLETLLPSQWSILRKGEIYLEKEVFRDSKGNSRGRGVAMGIVRASPKELWSVITNFDSFPLFMPRLISSHNYKSTKNQVFIEFSIKVMWKTITYHIEHRLDPANYSLTWNLDKNEDNDIADTQGYWKFYPLENGTSLVVYSVLVDTGHSMPQWLEDYMTRRDVPKTVEALRKRTESSEKWVKGK